MADKIDANIVDEVEKRLDDLFGDGGESSALGEESGDLEGRLTLEEGGGDVEDTPLKELKSIVLSIDWEITDPIMTKFLDQVDGLKDAYKDDIGLIISLVSMPCFFNSWAQSENTSRPKKPMLIQKL